MKHIPFTVFDKGSKPYIRVVVYREETKEFVSLSCSSFPISI